MRRREFATAVEENQAPEPLARAAESRSTHAGHAPAHLLALGDRAGRPRVRSVRAESPATGGLHGVGMRRDVGFVLEGIAPRAEIGSPSQAKRYLDLGVKHFCISTDMSILYEWFRDNGKAMREILTAAK